jgi:nucleoside-diphosphate-sugar epimerase
LGAGQVGPKLADELLGRGLRVRIVRRGEPGPERPGLEWFQGDLLDPDVARRACEGSSVVYHCVNPPRYDRWAQQLPPLFDAVVNSVNWSGAKLVVLDNLYMYGHCPEGGYREDTPMAPCSNKGELRAELAQRLLDLQTSGEMEIAIGRAADFFGPETPMSPLFHPRCLDQLRKGKTAEMIGNPDKLHSHSYTPDVARALAILGTSAPSWGQIWHLPITFQGTSRDLAERFANAVGNDLRIRKLQPWMLKLIGLVARDLSGVPEMLYQFEEDFVVDDSKFRAAFGDCTTPIDEAVRATLA